MKEMGPPSTAIRPPAEQMATILYSTLSFIFHCSWRAVKKHFSHWHPTLFRNMDDRKFQEERKIIKSCSSDDAKMASTGLSRQQNVKQRHM